MIDKRENNEIIIFFSKILVENVDFYFLVQSMYLQ